MLWQILRISTSQQIWTTLFALIHSFVIYFKTVYNTFAKAGYHKKVGAVHHSALLERTTMHDELTDDFLNEEQKSSSKPAVHWLASILFLVLESLFYTVSNFNCIEIAANLEAHVHFNYFSVLTGGTVLLQAVRMVIHLLRKQQLIKIFPPYSTIIKILAIPTTN